MLRICRLYPAAFPCLIVVAAFALTACTQHPVADAGGVAPIGTANATETAASEDSGHGKGYEFRIRYPALQPAWAPLVAAMRDFAAPLKRDLLDSAPTASATGRHYDLTLDFSIARHTEAFVSALADGDIDTGGAHPAPIVASFNLHPADGKLLSIMELFTNADAGLEALSAEARRQLEGRYEAKVRDNPSAMTPAQQASDIQSMRRWIEQGTEPKAENFRVFLVDGLDTKAIGLTLIFPPYQVAAYADGKQQIEVPAKVFYDLLKPEYRDAFAIDTEALQRGVR